MAKQNKPKPDNTIEERENGFYFPAWGIEVAKQSVVFNREFNKKSKKIIQKKSIVEVAKTERDAKKIVKQHYGADVDKDIPPPKTES